MGLRELEALAARFDQREERGLRLEQVSGRKNFTDLYARGSDYR